MTPGVEPHFLNGPVPSRIISTAVPEKTINPLFRDTEPQASDSLKSVCDSAERRQMFEATRSLPDTAYAAKRTATDFTLEIKQPLSEPSSLATRKQGSRSSTIAGKNTPLEKYLQVLPRYRYVLLDFKGHTDVRHFVYSKLITRSPAASVTHRPFATVRCHAPFRWDLSNRFPSSLQQGDTGEHY